MTSDAEMQTFYKPLFLEAASKPLSALESWRRQFTADQELSRRSLREHRQWFSKLRREAIAGAPPSDRSKVTSLAVQLEGLLRRETQEDQALLSGARRGAIEADAAVAELELARVLDDAPMATSKADGARLADAFSDFVEATSRLAQAGPLDRDVFAARLDRVEAAFGKLAPEPSKGAQAGGLTRLLAESKIWHAASVGDLEALGSTFDTWRALEGADDGSPAALQVKRRVMHGLSLVSYLHEGTIDTIEALFGELVVQAPPAEIADPHIAAIVAGAARDRSYAYATRPTVTSTDYEEILVSISIGQAIWAQHDTSQVAAQLMASMRDRMRAAGLIQRPRQSPMAIVAPLLEDISAIAAKYPGERAIVREHVESQLVVLDFASDFESYLRVKRRLNEIDALTKAFAGDLEFDIQWARALHLSVYAACWAIIRGAESIGAPKRDLDLLDAIVDHVDDAQIKYFRQLAHGNARSAARSIAPQRVIQRGATSLSDLQD